MLNFAIVCLVPVNVYTCGLNGRNLLTLERRPVFCYVNGGGGVQKLHPPCISETDWNFSMRFSPIGRESQAHYFRCLRNQKFQATPTKIKMAAVRPDVIMMLWFECDITEFPTASQILLRSSNTMANIWILSDVGVACKSKTTAANRKYICNVVYLSLCMR